MTAKQLAETILTLPEDVQNKEVVVQPKDYSSLQTIKKIRESEEAYYPVEGNDALIIERVKKDGHYEKLPDCYLKNIVEKSKFLVLTCN